MLETNLGGAFLCARAVLPRIEQRRHGRNVNVASVYGVVGRDGSLSRAEGGAQPRARRTP